MAETITAENLKARGYIEHSVPMFNKGATRFFQRRFRDDSGKTLYFIDHFYYEHTELPSMWETESYMERDGACVTTKIFNNRDLDVCEKIVADIFGLGMKAYDDDE